MDKRLEQEIAQGVKIAPFAAKIWGWEGRAGNTRFLRRSLMLTAHIDSGMRVLELGCGTGLYTKSVVKRGARVVAIDVSMDLLKVARVNVAAPFSVFLLQDAHRLGFSDCVFDSIVGSSVLHHCDAEKVLAECFRVLKQSGSIYLTEPNLANPQVFCQKLIPCVRKFMHDTDTERAFFLSQARGFLRAAGFKEIEIRYFDFLPPWMPAVFVPVAMRIGSWLEQIPFVCMLSGSLYIKAQK